MKNITLAFCIDSRRGMMFNKRRQVKDTDIIEDLSKRYGRQGIYITDFSKKLFTEGQNITVCDDPINDCPDNALCFIEDPDILSFEGVSTVVIYDWCIPYPADKYFTLDLSDLGFKCVSKDKLSTSIHKKVERKVYKK